MCCKGTEKASGKACDIPGSNLWCGWPEKIGALSRRSATDLVSCVVQDVEEARSQGWAATFVTPDVQGASDVALYNHLVIGMQEG